MDHEMLAIVEALRHWQPCLQGKKFVVCLDHRLLTFYLAQPNLPPCQLYWAENLAFYLLGIAFIILRDLLISFQMLSLDAMIF